MKKNRLMKVFAVLATATMAISAAGMTAAGAEREEEVNVYSLSRSAAAEEALTLKGANAKPGETVEIPLSMYTGNQCTAYDVVVEYDSRLEFVSVSGAKMSYDFEESGRKFVSILGYSFTPYQDGETASTIKFKVPENAENGNYDIRFENVSSFSSDYSDFANYQTNDTCITITGGVQRENSASLELTSVSGTPGGSALVQLVPTANNQCSNYGVLLEYDSRLTLEKSDISGANTMCVFEENGKSYVSLVGYTTSSFADGEAMAKLNFHIPADAAEGETFEVSFSEISNVSTEYYDFEEFSTTNAVISVVGSLGCKGDANVDGKTDIRDAALIARACSNKNLQLVTAEGEELGDVDENGALNIRDAAKIARYIANGKIAW